MHDYPYHRADDGNPRSRVEPKQFMYYQYLLISPSYYQAHLYRTTSGQQPPAGRVTDLDSVLAVYDVVGDVFTQPFEVWWEKNGEKIYRNVGREKIQMDLDQAQSREEYLDQFQQQLDEYLEVSRWPLQFLHNGAHERSMMTRLIMVQAMVLYPIVYATPVERWRLALALGLSPDYRGADGNLRTDSDPSVLDASDRNQLDVQAHNNLKGAINIAENAARGRFADANDLEVHFEFDYDLLAIILANNFEQDLELFSSRGSALAYMKPGQTRDRVIRWYEHPRNGRARHQALTRDQIIEGFEAIRRRHHPDT